jgi:hypothetical protein
MRGFSSECVRSAIFAAIYSARGTLDVRSWQEAIIIISILVR